MSSEFSKNYVSRYISDTFEDPSQNHFEAAYDVMNRHENAWWEYEDDRLRAGYQVFEDVLLIPVEKYKEGLSDLLNRPVSSSELRRNRDQLQREVKEALPQLESLGILYREKEDIRESQTSGLETSIDAAEKVVDEITEDLDFEIEENKDNDDNDFRIK